MPRTAGVRGFQASTAPMAYKLYVYQVHALSEVLEAITTVITTVRGSIYLGTDDTSTHPSIVEQQSPLDVTELVEKIDRLAGNLDQLAGNLDQLSEKVDKLAHQRGAEIQQLQQQLEVVSHKFSQFEPEAELSTITYDQS